MKLSLCCGCGRTIDDRFFYCPWCGNSKVEQKKDSDLDKMFTQLEFVQKQVIRKKIDEMERQLDDLENELSVLVLSAEMHK